MSEQLANFLVDLAGDPARLAQFAIDPVTGLSESDLSETERAAILSRNPHKVAAALGVDYLANGIANDLARRKDRGRDKDKRHKPKRRTPRKRRPQTQRKKRSVPRKRSKR